MSDAPTTTAPATILIVDDDVGLVRLLERTLEREGFLVATAASGRDAVEWLTRNTADLMLLDLKLQDIEGQELVNHLAFVGRGVPFIIITGQGDERIAVEMMKRGALDYLVKDVQFIGFVPSTIRRALEKLETNRRLAAAQADLEESRKQVLLVSEREQRRFGAELHDALGQQLTAIELRCQALKQDLPAARPDLEKQLSQICRFVRDAIGQTRSLARGLSPLHLFFRGLTEALGELAARMSAEGRLECVFDYPAPVLLNDEIAAGHLFRIAQEAVNNAVKHSGATKVVVRLARNGDGLRLEISDNGKGMPAAPALRQGIGLQIMRHRASVIGAGLEIKSKATKGGGGVQVICIVPDKK
jgi:signal transduction histidine kinase